MYRFAHFGVTIWRYSDLLVFRPESSEAFVDSSTATSSSQPYLWPRNVWVTRFGDKMYEDLDDARMLPGIKDLGGTRCQERRYVNKKIFQGLEQTVFIAILLASTGIPMHTSWCNPARNTSYCTRWAYLILDPNIGKKPYVAVRY